MTSKDLLRWTLIAIAALGLVVIACTSDDDPTATAAATDGAATATTAPETSATAPPASGGGAPPAAQPAADSGTLQTVLDRGELKCGVKDSQAGMGNLEDDGTFSGFDIEFCKAIAAAVFGDASKVDYVVASASDRFSLLENEEIDVLIRTTTFTFTRDVDLKSTFATTTFYDGQGMMVKDDSGIQSLTDMDGATICVTTGTTTEGNLNDTFAALGITYTPLAVADDAGSQENFLADRCDGWTGDRSNLAAQKSSYPAAGGGPDALRVLPEVMSKEPLGPATRDGDDEWSQIVNWVVLGMIAAAENGVTQDNVAAQAADPANAEIGNLLGNTLPIGTLLGLGSDTFMQDVIAAVGNYSEAYARTIGVLLPQAGSQNALWTDGGLIYAPPVK